LLALPQHRWVLQHRQEHQAALRRGASKSSTPSANDLVLAGTLRCSAEPDGSTDTVAVTW
jgi:hypothetical protein